jgi:RNA polymerase sigma-70 factor (ECF subfamily)
MAFSWAADDFFLQFGGGFRPRCVTIKISGFREGPAMMVDPEQMIQEARMGTDAVLGPLLDLYRNYLRLLARLEIGRQLQGKLDASDIVQETFLEAHRNFARFQGTSEPQFVSWLRQILAAKAANLLRHYLGTQGRDVRLERELATNLDNSSRALGERLIGPWSSPSQQAVRREQSVLLADALERLPADYREVIVLRHLEGLSFPEVARCMGRSVDSVQKLWLRALARLRRSFGESE